MDIKIKQTKNATIVQPQGERLDLEVSGQFRTRLIDLIQNGHRNIVVDLSGVSFIDSSGLGALVSALKTLKTSKERREENRPDSEQRPTVLGDVRLAALQPPVVSLFEIIRLDRVFTSFPTAEDAARSFVD